VAFTIPNEGDAFHADQAEPDKVDIDILVAGLAGNGVVSGCTVTAQGSPDMTVAVAAGVTRNTDGSTATVASGNVTITAADATNPRIDLIVVGSTGTKSATAGTAAASPVFPAIPATSVVLAAVYVPANDTTIATNQITDKRVVFPTISGTSFPASPRAGDLFWRSDLLLDFVYDGTRWLTTTRFDLPFTQIANSPTSATVQGYVPLDPTYGMYIEAVQGSTLVATTNDGTKYWSIAIRWNDAANTPTTLVTIITQSDTPTNWVFKNASVAAVLNAGARSMDIYPSKVSTPGNLWADLKLVYRLIGT
jgi:hypothetical protein